MSFIDYRCEHMSQVLVVGNFQSIGGWRVMGGPHVFLQYVLDAGASDLF